MLRQIGPDGHVALGIRHEDGGFLGRLFGRIGGGLLRRSGRPDHDLEHLFRGFLFRAMLSKNNPIVAVIVTAVTFGIGHIVNLFTGQTSAETVMQIVFAVSWGFILTMVCYKSGSLVPSILAHALIDAFSMFAADQEKAAWVYIGATIVIGVLYCIYLSRLQPPKPGSADACA